MPRYAVSYIDWFDHDLTTIIVAADTPEKALQLHPKIGEFDINYSMNMENIKQQFFNCDAMVECVEIP